MVQRFSPQIPQFLAFEDRDGEAVVVPVELIERVYSTTGYCDPLKATTNRELREQIPLWVVLMKPSATPEAPSMFFLTESEFNRVMKTLIGATC